jgi:hypothetical protein
MHSLSGERFTIKVDDRRTEYEFMTLRELQKQALQLPINERWQLVQTLLESLQQETYPTKKKAIYPVCGVLLKVQSQAVAVNFRDFEDTVQ